MNANNTYISTFLPLTQGNATPSTVRIYVPVAGGGTPIRVTGIIENDITFSLSNRFAPILPDAADLQEIFSIFESGSMPSWIGTSSQVWKGTNPISFSFDMYVINWSPECKSESELKSLAQLCTVSPADNMTKDNVSEWTVTVHGGYRPAILKGNKTYFTEGMTDENGNLKGDYYGTKDGQSGSSLTDEGKKTLDSTLANYVVGQDAKNGMVTLHVGSKAKIGNLLLTRCDITPSVVEVYSPSADKDSSCPPRPLYYRVGLSMQTCRTALSTDIPGLFGLS